MYRGVHVSITDPAPWATLEPYEPRSDVVAHFEQVGLEEGCPLYVVAAWPWLVRLPRWGCVES